MKTWQAILLQLAFAGAGIGSTYTTNPVAKALLGVFAAGGITATATKNSNTDPAGGTLVKNPDGTYTTAKQ